MSINDVIKLELTKLGASQLKHPIFYNFPVGIRFEIGIGEIYDDNSDLLPAFLEAAQYRVNQIFQRLFPNGPDIFAFEIFVETENIANEIIGSFLDINFEYKGHQSFIDNIEVDCPWFIDHKNFTHDFRKRITEISPSEAISEKIDNDGEIIWRVTLYWNLSQCVIDFSKLFKVIILADIVGEMTALTSSTYLFNLNKDMVRVS